MCLTLILLFAIHPPKYEHRAIFRDISLSQALFAAKMSLGFDVPIKILGRVKIITIEVRPYYVTAYANGFNVLNDPLRWVRIIYARPTREYSLKAEALGGLIELDGTIPP